MPKFSRFNRQRLSLIGEAAIEAPPTQNTEHSLQLLSHNCCGAYSHCSLHQQYHVRASDTCDTMRVTFIGDKKG